MQLRLRGIEVAVDRREQCVEIDRLLKEFVGDVIGAACLAGGQSGNDEDRQVRSQLILPFQEIPTVDRRHAEVGNHEIRFMLFNETQGLFATDRRDDAEGLARQHAAKALSYRRIVIDQQDGGIGIAPDGGQWSEGAFKLKTLSLKAPRNWVQRKDWKPRSLRSVA